MTFKTYNTPAGFIHTVSAHGAIEGWHEDKDTGVTRPLGALGLDMMAKLVQVPAVEVPTRPGA